MIVIEYFFKLLFSYIEFKYKLKADFEKLKMELRPSPYDKLIRELANQGCYFTHKKTDDYLETGFPFGEHEKNQKYGMIINESLLYPTPPEILLATLIDMSVKDLKGVLPKQ